MKIILITEGIEGTGMGHLTRCLSLYQAFCEKGYRPLFIANTNEQGSKIIGNINYVTLNWLKDTEKLYSLTYNSDIIVVDSYLAPLAIYKTLSEQTRKIIYIDDYARLIYPSGIILNGTVGAEKLYPAHDPNHKFLLGPAYIPLRKEFWDIVPENKQPKIFKKFLISFGGQDLRGLTFPVLQLLKEHFPDAHFDIVTGSKHSKKNNKFSSSQNVHFYENIDAPTMIWLMKRSDVAISAAGQTLYELARLNKPFVAIGTIENQRNNILGFKSAGFIHNEIWYDNPRFENLICDELQFLQKDSLGKIIEIDGQGSRRVANYVCG